MMANKENVTMWKINVQSELSNINLNCHRGGNIVPPVGFLTAIF